MFVIRVKSVRELLDELKLFAPELAEKIDEAKRQLCNEIIEVRGEEWQSSYASRQSVLS